MPLKEDSFDNEIVFKKEIDKFQGEFTIPVEPLK
jgi:hypothetical protein